MSRERRPGGPGAAAPWLRGSSGRLVLAALALAAPASAQLVTDPGKVVRTIDASQWSAPASDAAGIAYRPDTGELLTCDSEVDETVEGISHYQGVNGFSGSLTGTASPQALSVGGDEAVQARFKSSGGSPPASCGIGPELAALLPLLAWLRGRRRQPAPVWRARVLAP